MRSRAKDERGAVLVLVAVMLIVILGMAALVVDVGQWFDTKRQAQNAADAAALAAVGDLPTYPTTAQSDAQSYVNQNISGASATITTPYNSDSSEIRVTVSKDVPSVFGGLFGVSFVTVSASATAKEGNGASRAAFFAMDSSCSDPGVSISGNNINVNGAVRSNGPLTMNGNNASFGPTTYGGPNNCSFSQVSNNATYNGSATPSVDNTVWTWPYDYSQDTITCNYNYPNGYTFNGSNTTLAAGVYCTPGIFTISGNNVNGNVTFIAAAFNLSANSVNFTPYYKDLALYETGTSTLTVNGNSFVNGTIFAPNASIVVSANSGNAAGFLEGQTVTIVSSANNFNFTGTGPVIGTSGGSLIQ